MRQDWPPPRPSPHPRYPGCSSVSWLWGLSNQNTKAELPDENLPMRLCNWGQAQLWGALIPGEGAQAVQQGPRETLVGRGEVGETVSLQASPSAPPQPTAAPLGSPPLPPSLAPPISPENGMFKTGCMCNLFRKERPIHRSWAISQEAFSKHTGFQKLVFMPQLATFFFFLHIHAALIFSINSFISESY